MCSSTVFDYLSSRYSEIRAAINGCPIKTNAFSVFYGSMFDGKLYTIVLLPYYFPDFSPLATCVVRRFPENRH